MARTINVQAIAEEAADADDVPVPMKKEGVAGKSQSEMDFFFPKETLPEPHKGGGGFFGVDKKGFGFGSMD
jgi:hypothetical protein